ncbi:type IV pilin protein [Thiohalobacter sp. IOR34]|uniref:type IV pilin protein n=1 Tax=Thiohalobacter sp. IOR34 TaxID=3057176 RepID=UPI0025B0C837|nr:type IV pilin protein [Thiohalobacter sp. IOR34]WJW75084.1 type IV pilin protein [Thiohalobacter sp. IOR34]
MRDRARGFSLLELLVTVAVLAILAGLAIPTYQEARMRSRRGDAIASLLRLQLAQEAWRAGDVDYATLQELGWPGSLSLDGHYHLRLERRSAAGYLITATPRPGGAQAGDRCGRFALNEEGPHLAPGYADAGCWQH